MKNNKIIISICVLMLLVPIAMFTGCQEEEPFNKYENDIYLHLPSDIDFQNLTDTELDIVLRAFFRLDINENKDGLFKIKQTCGAQVNISEEIFTYFRNIVDHTNEQIFLSEIIYSRDRVKTRQEFNPMTNCIAHTIAYASGGSFADIDGWINETYGDKGVPAHEVFNVMNHFFSNGAQMGLSNFNNTDIMGGNYIIVINYSHAVNLVAKKGTTVYYYDPQNNQSTYCSAYSVTSVYEIR